MKRDFKRMLESVFKLEEKTTCQLSCLQRLRSHKYVGLNALTYSTAFFKVLAGRIFGIHGILVGICICW